MEVLDLPEEILEFAAQIIGRDSIVDHYDWKEPIIEDSARHGAEYDYIFYSSGVCR